MSYRRPVLRPVTCSTRKESSSTPCSGEPRSPRTSGLLILMRVAGGTDRFTVLVIAQHLLPTSLPRGGRRTRGFGHVKAGRGLGQVNDMLRRGGAVSSGLTTPRRHAEGGRTSFR